MTVRYDVILQHKIYMIDYMKLCNIILGGVLTVTSAMAQSNEEPISLHTMGSLMYGGTVTEMPDGSTFHGDHGYAQYYIPTGPHTYSFMKRV